MTTMRVVGECFFWYRLTRVFPDKFHSRKTVVLCVLSAHSGAHMEAESILINVAGRLLLFQRDRSTASGKAPDAKEKRVRMCLSDGFLYYVEVDDRTVLLLCSISIFLKSRLRQPYNLLLVISVPSML